MPQSIFLKAAMRHLPSFILAFSCLAVILPAAHAAKPVKAAKPDKAIKERVVLMPLRVPDEDKSLMGSMETALVEGLQQKYEVFSGEQVATKAKAIFLKESRNTAKKECDETRCMQDIAIAFQAEHIATANVTKRADGYFLALSIQNIFDNKVIYSKSTPCKNCDAYQVVDKLKELSGATALAPTIAIPDIPPPIKASDTPARAIALPEVPAAPRVAGKENDAETQVWAEVVAGNKIEDYKLYLDSYPQGKYAKLATDQTRKLEAYARANALAEAIQAEAKLWAEVVAGNKIEDYQRYLASYPQGKYAKQATEQTRKLEDYAKAVAIDEIVEGQEKAWNEAQKINSQLSYNRYMNKYPRGSYAALAKIKLKKIVLAAEMNVGQKIKAGMVPIPGKNYEMGKYEVTQAEWKAVMGSNPSHFVNCGDTCPVEQVSWNDIQDFLQKLNVKTGSQYRLPTEAEWEYTCYGGSKTEYCGSNDINAVAWYDKNSNNTTHPVGQKQANGYGIYDMSGNVFEWLGDCYEGDCAARVLRGSSWNDSDYYTRSPKRYRHSLESRFNYFGFRLARTLP